MGRWVTHFRGNSYSRCLMGIDHPLRWEGVLEHCWLRSYRGVLRISPLPCKRTSTSTGSCSSHPMMDLGFTRTVFATMTREAANCTRKGCTFKVYLFLCRWISGILVLVCGILVAHSISSLIRWVAPSVLVLVLNLILPLVLFLIVLRIWRSLLRKDLALRGRIRFNRIGLGRGCLSLRCQSYWRRTRKWIIRVLVWPTILRTRTST